MIFEIFLKMAIPIMAIPMKNLSLKNVNLGWKMKILKFLAIQPIRDLPIKP